MTECEDRARILKQNSQLEDCGVIRCAVNVSLNKYWMGQATHVLQCIFTLWEIKKTIKIYQKFI